MKKENPDLKGSIASELLAATGKTYRGEKLCLSMLGAVTLAGVVAWVVQLRQGLAVTAMRDYVSWGIYISLLFFFVGISLVGAFVSSVLRFSGASWRHSLTRIAEAVTLSAILFAAFMPVLDMGRPERLFFLVSHGRIQSPILWDVVAILTYLAGSLLYFYLPLIPDLALMRDNLPGISARKKKIFNWMSLGWNGSPAQRRLLERGMRILSVVILPVAVSVHTISAWLIAMTLRSGWNTSLMGPYFVFGALMAGCALLILVTALLRRVYRLEHYLAPLHFRNLGACLLVLAAFYLYLTLNKYGVPAYTMEKGEREVLYDLFFGHYAPLFWFVQLVGTALPVVLLSIRRVRHSIKGVVTASVLVLLGALVNRFLLVIPNMLHPFFPIQNPPSGFDLYHPTWIEWAIAASSMTGFLLVILLLFRVFPVVAIDEVAQEANKVGERELGLQPAKLPKKSAGRGPASTFSIVISLLLSSLPLSAQEESDKPIGVISMEATLNDSAYIVAATAKEALTDQAIAGAELVFYVERTFGLLQVGEGTTDSLGAVRVEFKADIPPGDSSGKIIIVAKASDTDAMADTSAQITAPSRLAFPPDVPVPRSMVGPRAPVWLIASFASVMAIVWGLFGYVVFLLYKINRSSATS